MLEILDRVKGSPSASTGMATTTPAAVDRTTADAAPSDVLIPDKFVDVSGESASSPAARDASQEVDDTALPTTTSCGAVATPTRFSDASSDHDRDSFELWVPSASRTPSTTPTSTQDVIPVNAISDPSTQSIENATMIRAPTRCSTLGFTQDGGALLKALAGVDDLDASVIEPSALTYTNVCNTMASSSPVLPQASSTPSTPSSTLAATQEVVLAVLVVRSGHLTVTPTRCSTPSPCGDIGVLLTSTAPTANATTEQFKGVHSSCLMQGHSGDTRVLLSMKKPAVVLFEEMHVKGYIEKLVCMWSPRTSSCYSGFGVPFRHPWPPSMCMGFSRTGFEELRLPWPPPKQVKIISMRAELRPLPWPSFQCWQGVLPMLPVSWLQPKIIRASVVILGSLHDVHDSSMELMELFPSANSACPQVVLPVLIFIIILEEVERVSQCWSRWITVALLEFVNRPSPVTLRGSLPECVQDKMFYGIGHLILLHLCTKNLQLPWDSSGVLLFYCQHYQVLMLYVQQQLPLASVWWFVPGLLSGGFSCFRYVNGVACIQEILWYGLQLTTVLLLQIKCTILDSMEPMQVSGPRYLKLGFLMIVSQLVYAEECSILDQITKRNVHRRLHLVEGRLMAKQRCCTWHSEDVRQAIFDLSLRLFAEHRLWGSSDLVHDQEADCFISSIQEVNCLPAMAGSWSCNTNQSSVSWILFRSSPKSYSYRELLDGYLVTYGRERTEEARF